MLIGDSALIITLFCSILSTGACAYPHSFHTVIFLQWSGVVQTSFAGCRSARCLLCVQNFTAELDEDFARFTQQQMLTDGDYHFEPSAAQHFSSANLKVRTHESLSHRVLRPAGFEHVHCVSVWLAACILRNSVFVKRFWDNIIIAPVLCYR